MTDRALWVLAPVDFVYFLDTFSQSDILGFYGLPTDLADFLLLEPVKFAERWVGGAFAERMSVLAHTLKILILLLAPCS
ncbi:hypothetical protein EBR78_08265, partial [bacterium]|nr:hypothetical protein [bacterium]